MLEVVVLELVELRELDSPPELAAAACAALAVSRESACCYEGWSNCQAETPRASGDLLVSYTSYSCVRLPCELAHVPSPLSVGTWQVLPYALTATSGRKKKSTLPVQDVFGPPCGTGVRLVPSFAAAETLRWRYPSLG